MNIDFNKTNGLVPAIIQDDKTHNVLMLGYMNQEALTKTLDTKLVTFFSRTKQRLWTKGEDSGNVLNLVSIQLDCDRDTLLIKVNPKGPTCHKGSDTCWNEANEPHYGWTRWTKGLPKNCARARLATERHPDPYSAA